MTEYTCPKCTHEYAAEKPWPCPSCGYGTEQIMCKLVLPVAVKELSAIAVALTKLAKEEGKEARMREVNGILEIFSV